MSSSAPAQAGREAGLRLTVGVTCESNASAIPTAHLSVNS